MYLGEKGNTAAVGGGSHAAAGLLLLKHSSKTIDARVEMHLEKERAVCDTVSTGKYEDGRSGEITERSESITPTTISTDGVNSMFKHFLATETVGRTPLYVSCCYWPTYDRPLEGSDVASDIGA